MTSAKGEGVCQKRTFVKGVWVAKPVCSITLNYARAALLLGRTLRGSANTVRPVGAHAAREQIYAGLGRVWGYADVYIILINFVN